jgi:hypothetical protein
MYDAHAIGIEIRDEKAKEARLARIEALEDAVFDRASSLIEAALSFHEVSPAQTEPSAEWIAQYGLEGALQRLQVAKAGWLPQSVAPSALKLAAQVWVGTTRGRAFKGLKLTQNNLNVKINLPAPTSSDHPGPEVYAVKDIE